MNEKKNLKERGRGRPPLPNPPIQIRLTLTLHSGIDDDLIEWFESIPNGQKALTIKIALRQGGMTLVKQHSIREDLMDDDLFAEFLDAL